MVTELVEIKHGIMVRPVVRQDDPTPDPLVLQVLVGHLAVAVDIAIAFAAIGTVLGWLAKNH